MNYVLFTDGAHSEPELDETTTDNSGEKSTDAGEDTEKADEDKEKENKKWRMLT